MNTTNPNDSKDTLSKNPVKNFVIGLLVILVFLLGHSLFAQVGVGNTNPQAQLDISASNTTSPTNLDGILIPRVTNLPADVSMTANQDGMLVFYDNTGEDGKGFYYWDDTASDWIKIAAGTTGDNDWTEVGANIERQTGDVYIGDIPSTNNDLYISDQIIDWDNTSYIINPDGDNKINEIELDDGDLTDPSLYFEGDTDFGLMYNPLSNKIFLVENGSQRLGLRKDGGIEPYDGIKIGINSGLNNTSSSNIFIGSSAGSSNTTGGLNYGIGNSSLNSVTTNGINIAIGQSVLSSYTGNTVPGNNVSIGHYSMNDMIDGSLNTAVGISAMENINFNSNSNVAIGTYALRNLGSGTENTVLGYSAGNVSDGSYNLYLGFGSGYNADGDRNIFLGYRSGYNAPTGSDMLYIENSNSNTPLVYGEFDNDILRINGELQVGIPTGTGYAFPTVDGTANQIMTTDGSGQINFANVSALFTDTDDQNIQNLSFNSSTNVLTVGIENGSSQTVNLSSLSTSDSDWLVNPTNAIPTNNSDDIYTQGKVSIGGTLNNGDLNVYHNTSNDGSIDYLLYNFLAGSSISDDKTMIYNNIAATGTGNRTGLYNLMIGNGSGTYRGLQNYSYGIVSGDVYGMYNTFSATGGGDHYGSYTSLTGTGGGTKYGTYNTISTSAGGTHYGVYTNVQKSNSYAAYLIGRTSLGSTLSNRYLMPAADGTNGQVIQTDGVGNLSWTTLSSTTASNGLTETANDIQLGGTLTQNTTIIQGVRSFDINLNSTGDFAIQDAGTDVFFVEDSGDIGIGNSNPGYQLHITENTATETRAVYIDKDDNTTASTEGVYVDKTSNGTGRNHGYYANVNGTGNGNRYGIYTDVNGTGTGQKYGIFNEVDCNTTGSQYAVRNWVRGESGSNQFGVFNNMDNANTADIYGVYNGMRVTNASNMYGVYNEFLTANNTSTLMAGVRNRFTNGIPGGDGFSGVYTDFDLTANGTYYGTRNEFSAGSTGSGSKYGTYNLISASAGGTHYGTYNSVSVADGWAGYFLGRNYISDRLSIGETNNASAKLSINVNSSGGTGVKHIELKEDAANDGARLIFSNTAETTNSWTFYGRADDTNADSRLNIFYSGSGNVIEIYGDNTVEVNGQFGVNLNNPTYAIHLPNNVAIGTGQGRANAWTTYSDNRVKSNQQSLENGLSLVNQMTPKTYFHHSGNFENGILNLSNDGENTLGFIAQELYEVLPEAVQKPKNETKSLWSINYDKIIPVTVKAIQELNIKIENLEAENAALKEKLSKMEQLEARLAAVEKYINNNDTTNTISASTDE